MKPSIARANHRVTIRRTVEANRATNPQVFAFVLRGDDSETNLFDLDAVHHELNRLLGASVDIVAPAGSPVHPRSRPGRGSPRMSDSSRRLNEHHGRILNAIDKGVEFSRILDCQGPSH